MQGENEARNAGAGCLCGYELFLYVCVQAEPCGVVTGDFGGGPEVLGGAAAGHLLPPGWETELGWAEETGMAKETGTNRKCGNAGSARSAVSFCSSPPPAAGGAET